MPFMYLIIDVDVQNGTIRASVKNSGKLLYKTLGTDSARLSNGPSAVFQIDGFDGIKCINDDDVIEEIKRRFSNQGLDLMHKIGIYLTDEELIDMIRERMG
jgi:hypothetical protein